MDTPFGENMRKLRTEKGLSQKDLGDQLFVYKSTVSRWEKGDRLPDATMIPKIARCLGVDSNTLFRLVAESEKLHNVIMVDDNKAILSHGLTILGEVIQNAEIKGFIRPVEAVEYAKMNRFSLAVLDIELGTVSGLELCRSLLEINPCTNVVFLTAFSDYSLDAWKTGACGFILKPMTPGGLKEQLKNLRYPLSIGGSDK